VHVEAVRLMKVRVLTQHGMPHESRVRVLRESQLVAMPILVGDDTEKRQGLAQAGASLAGVR